MSHPDDNDELERRLRAAFAARAEQIGPHDIDTDREDAVAEMLRASSTPSRTRRVVAGVGILAAAAAAIGVVALAIRPTPHATDAARPLTSVSASSTIGVAPPEQTATSSRSNQTPDVVQGPPGQPLTTIAPPPTSSATSTTTPPATTTSTTPPATETTHSALSASGGSTSTALPPALPSGLPQSGELGDGEYAGAVPLADTGGGTRMLSMPDDLRWEVTSRDDHSMTVRITYLPTDIEAYWRDTLPAQGWQQADGGWSFPDTAYAVSPITDKGSFTVSW